LTAFLTFVANVAVNVAVRSAESTTAEVPADV